MIPASASRIDALNDARRRADRAPYPRGNLLSAVRLDRIHPEWVAPCCPQGRRSRRPRGHRSRHRRPPPHSGTPTRYEPPLTFLLPASHVAIWWTGTGVWQRRVRWRCNRRASRARGGLRPSAARRTSTRPRRGRPRGRRPSRDHRWSQSVIGQDRIGGCMFPLSMP